MLSFPTLATLFTVALAAPAPSKRAVEIPENWTWEVTGWHAGCVRSGCTYDFNVTIPTIPNEIDGITAYCAGYESGNTYILCSPLEGGDNNAVAAKLGPRPEDGTGPKEVFVSFERTVGGSETVPATVYNYTGSAEAVYNAFVSPLRNFTVTPTEVTGVA